MARPKTVTIKLTAKQRDQVRGITGVDHDEIRLERTTAAKKRQPLAAKVAPAKKGGGQGGGPPILGV